MRKSGYLALFDCLRASCYRVRCKQRTGRSAFTVACRNRIFDVISTTTIDSIHTTPDDSTFVQVSGPIRLRRDDEASVNG